VELPAVPRNNTVTDKMRTIFHLFFSILYSQCMVICMVNDKIGGKKKATSTAQPKLKVAKVVTPKKEKTNTFEGKVKITNVTNDNPHFRKEWFSTFRVQINAKTPPQAQRKTVMRRFNRVTFYNPTTSKKNLLVAEMKKELDDDHETFSGTVLVIINIHRKIPKSNPTFIKKGDYCITTPDIDNLQKFLFDAMDGLFYDDDKQIGFSRISKRYDDHDHVEIFIANERTTKMVVMPDSDIDSDDDDDDESLWKLTGKFIKERAAGKV